MQINDIAHVGRVPGETLGTIFEAMWPLLEAKLAEVQRKAGSETHRERSDRELLEELLRTVRALQIQHKEETRPANIEQEVEGSPVSEYEASMET